MTTTFKDKLSSPKNDIEVIGGKHWLLKHQKTVRTIEICRLHPIHDRLSNVSEPLPSGLDYHCEHQFTKVVKEYGV